MNLKKKKQSCTCDYLKTSNLSDLDGSTPKPAIRSGDTGQRITCFDSSQLITKLWNIDLQYECNISLHLGSQIS